MLVGARGPLRKEDLPEPLRFLGDVQYLHLPNGFGKPNVQLLVDKLLAQRPDLNSQSGLEKPLGTSVRQPASDQN